MGKKIIYHTLFVTGLVVGLVGVQNLYTFYGDITIAGITGQVTGVICVIGGLVNIGVARKIRKTVMLQKKLDSMS